MTQHATMRRIGECCERYACCPLPHPRAAVSSSKVSAACSACAEFHEKRVLLGIDTNRMLATRVRKQATTASLAPTIGDAHAVQTMGQLARLYQRCSLNADTSAHCVQSNDDIEEFLKTVFSFLKRNTGYLAKEGADKQVAKLARQFQPSQKVRTAPEPC